MRSIATVGITIGILSIISIITQDWSFIKLIVSHVGLTAMFTIFGGLIAIIIIFRFLEYLLKPSYINVTLGENEIVINTFTPNNRHALSLVQILRYKNYIKEWRLRRYEYNNYKLLIERFGLKKVLLLQKINKKGIYETSGINISFLGQKKYSDLILSIDRLKDKFNLN